jgi:ribonuclease HI
MEGPYLTYKIMMDKLLINVDGACQGNPGAASIGVVITDQNGAVVEEIGSYIGRTTNNVAEYRSLITGIEAVINYMPKRAIFFMDSQLVVNQINGLYRVRQPHLNALHQEADELLDQLPSWEVKYVERTANWQAHRVAQRALIERGNGNAESTPQQGGSVIERIYSAAEGMSEYHQRKLLKFAQQLIEDAKSD